MKSLASVRTRLQRNQPLARSISHDETPRSEARVFHGSPTGNGPRRWATLGGSVGHAPGLCVGMVGPGPEIAPGPPAVARLPTQSRGHGTRYPLNERDRAAGQRRTGFVSCRVDMGTRGRTFIGNRPGRSRDAGHPAANATGSPLETNSLAEGPNVFGLFKGKRRRLPKTSLTVAGLSLPRCRSKKHHSLLTRS